ncbi:MAG: cation:proton antiporter subunit C [Lachnospiraceae bacterium]|nr:cation:proton antiporter subunit C [Lachnospiraceae bacterium]
MNNYQEAVAVILFGIGFATLLFQRNLIRKLIGMNIMDAGLFLFLTSLGYINGRKAPIVTNGVTDLKAYINPVPSGLVLTGIVVSVSVTAVMLSLTIRLYRRYHTLDMDEIYAMTLREREEND